MTSALAVTDFKTSVPRVLLPIPLTGPAPSGSADTSRLCQGCSHPPRHLPDQAALSSYRAAATTRRQRSLTSTQITAPHGARSRRSMRLRSPSTAGSPRLEPNDAKVRSAVYRTVPVRPAGPRFSYPTAPSCGLRPAGRPTPHIRAADGCFPLCAGPPQPRPHRPICPAPNRTAA